MSLTRALDTSRYQGLLNCAALKSHYGLGWMAFKATEGETYTDPDFARNWQSAQDAALGRAAYAYAHPELSATVQADHLALTARPKPGDVLVCDLERGTTQTATNAWAIAFAKRIRVVAPGIPLWLYMGTGYAGSNTGKNLSAYYDRWWVPHYYTSGSTWPGTFAPAIKGNKTGWAAPHIWQWSQSLDNRYDADVSPMTFEQLRGDDMPLTAEDAALVAKAVWAYQLASKRPGTPGQLIPAGPYLTSVDANTSATLPIAAAVQVVAEALQAGVPGQTQTVVDALTTALKDSVVNVAVTVAGNPVGGTP